MTTARHIHAGAVRAIGVYLAVAVATYLLAHRGLETERQSAENAARGRWEAIRQLAAGNVQLGTEGDRLAGGPAEADDGAAAEPAVASHAEAAQLWLALQKRGAFVTVAKVPALSLDAQGMLPPEFATLFELSPGAFESLRERVAGIKREADRLVAANATVRPGAAEGTAVIEVQMDPAAATLRGRLEEALREALGPDDYALLATLQKAREPSSLMNARRGIIEYFGDEPRTFTVVRNPQPRGYNLTFRNPTAGLTLNEMSRPALEAALGPLTALLPEGF